MLSRKGSVKRLHKLFDTTMDTYYDEEATQKAARIAWLNGEGAGGGGVLARGTPLPRINFLRLGLISGAVALFLILFLAFIKRQKRQR